MRRSFKYHYEMWTLNNNTKKNSLVYQDCFSSENKAFYKIDDSIQYDQLYMTLTLYYKERIIVLTYDYEDCLEKEMKEINTYQYKIEALVSQRCGWDMNRYKEDIKKAKLFDGNVEKMIDDMLDQNQRDWFKETKAELINKLNSEIKKY